MRQRSEASTDDHSQACRRSGRRGQVCRAARRTRHLDRRRRQVVARQVGPLGRPALRRRRLVDPPRGAVQAVPRAARRRARRVRHRRRSGASVSRSPGARGGESAAARVAHPAPTRGCRRADRPEPRGGRARGERARAAQPLRRRRARSRGAVRRRGGRSRARSALRRAWAIRRRQAWALRGAPARAIRPAGRGGRGGLRAACAPARRAIRRRRRRCAGRSGSRSPRRFVVAHRRSVHDVVIAAS